MSDRLSMNDGPVVSLHAELMNLRQGYLITARRYADAVRERDLLQGQARSAGERATAQLTAIDNLQRIAGEAHDAAVAAEKAAACSADLSVRAAAAAWAGQEPCPLAQLEACAEAARSAALEAHESQCLVARLVSEVRATAVREAHEVVVQTAARLEAAARIASDAAKDLLATEEDAPVAAEPERPDGSVAPGVRVPTPRSRAPKG